MCIANFFGINSLQGYNMQLSNLTEMLCDDYEKITDKLTVGRNKKDSIKCERTGKIYNKDNIENIEVDMLERLRKGYRSRKIDNDISYVRAVSILSKAILTQNSIIDNRKNSPMGKGCY